MAKDAWEKFEDFKEEYSTDVDVREFNIFAAAYDRCIRINDEPHNVSTIQDLILALQDAVDFVNKENPEWASDQTGVEECEQHLTHIQDEWNVEVQERLRAAQARTAKWVGLFA